MTPTAKKEAGVGLSRFAFAASTTLLIYTIVGYPLLVALLSRLRPRPVRKQTAANDEALPTVSLIIAAYNEEAAILEKLENTFALDYPSHKLEVIVASDCSSDRTDALVCEHPRYHDENWGGVRLCRNPERSGKTGTQNYAAATARGDILLFSDATTDYEADVLRVLVANFADPEVGCVAGRLIYFDPNLSGVGRGARAYWDYETLIKTSESQIFSLIGVSGQMYAVRRDAFHPLPPESSSDFVIANAMVVQGLRAVFEPNAVCREITNVRVKREIAMRTRIMAQTYYDLWDMRAMMNPMRSGFYAVQLWSHKVFRYAVPLFLLVNFLASTRLASRSKLHRTLFGVQILGCGLAALASLLERTPAQGHKITQILSIPRYVLFSNAAPFMALWQVLRGERYAKWDTAREALDETDTLIVEGRSE